MSCLNYRFNLGFEPAIIRSQQPLRLYEWHAVLLSRDEKEGNLTIDGKPPVTGVSKGSSTGLNLNQNLHVGGVPDFSAINALSGFKTGFIGCLSYLAIDGKVAGLGKIFQCYLRRVMNCFSFHEQQWKDQFPKNKHNTIFSGLAWVERKWSCVHYRSNLNTLSITIFFGWICPALFFVYVKIAD